MSENWTPEDETDFVVVRSMIESLREDPHYSEAQRVAGLMVLEVDTDGAPSGFLVIGDRAQQVKLDLSRLAEGLVVAEAA